MRDLHNNLKVAIALNAQTIATATTTNGVIIDTQGYDSLEFLIQAGTLADGTYTPLIQEGDKVDLSDAGEVADSDLLGTEAQAALDTSNTVSKIGYVGSKRYVRLSIVSANTSDGGVVGALAIQGHAAKAPVA